MAKAKKKSKAAATNNSSSGKRVGKSRNRFAVFTGISFFIALYCYVGGGFRHFKSLQNALSSTILHQPPSAMAPTSEALGDSFLNWFIENGGVFHPINATHNDGGVQITIEKFEGMGWGLAAVVNNSSTLDTASTTLDDTTSSSDDDTCKNEEICTRQQSQNNIIIPHLAPLFTVPSNLIISISSILDTYSSPSSEVYLPHFYDTVNKVLLTSFPHGQGLAKMSKRNPVRMGLVEQDVVIATMLMTEECLHQNNDQQNSSSSFWGPYLDMLPSTSIPRLDTFGDEEYAMLNDATLERIGRSSKERLKAMFYGMSGGSGDLSVRAVLRDMIQVQQRANTYGAAMTVTVPPTCLEFDTFHKFIGIVSSRAMVLKGVKYLTPLAEMINYAPVSPMEQIAHPPSSGDELDDQHEIGQGNMIHTPFDLYHTIGENDSITVRSDRNVVLQPQQQSQDMTSIQIFEDYGPVDSSLFLEMHAFVPDNNPYDCAVIQGRHFFRRPPVPGRSDLNLNMLLRALKILRLTNPQLTQFMSLEDICVRKDMTIVEDGNLIGRRPASDSIAIMALLLGESSDVFPNLDEVKSKCITAIESNDVERVELQCARYPRSGHMVKRALVIAAKRAVGGASVSLETLSSLFDEVESGNEKMALALQFRIEEMKILHSIANTSTVELESIKPVVTEATNDDLLDAKLSSFNAFIDSLALPVNKIRAQAVEGLRIGAVATHDLESEEAYISLPSDAVINSDTAIADAEISSPTLANLLKKYNSQSSDGFDLLLVYILHERYVRMDQSKWWPYFRLLPTIEDLRSSHPLFFEEDEMNRYLGGSDVRKFILRNQRRANERQSALISDLDVHTVLGTDIILDRSIFYWANAILDSRSIWFEGRRNLCPLLDLVNADPIGRAHETKMDKSFAVTRASRPVNRGEQIFENYEQPNYILFAFHGFMLENNPNDCALLTGLSINRNNHGANPANRPQASPTFCISRSNIESLKELTQFLRQTRGLSTNHQLGLEDWLNEDDVPYLTQVLEQRVARLGDAADVGFESELDEAAVTVGQRKAMTRMAKSDLDHLRGALELLKPKS